MYKQQTLNDKRNEFMKFEEKWMALDNITLSKVTHIKKDKYCICLI